MSADAGERRVWRAKMRALRDGLDAAYRTEADRAMAQIALEWSLWRQAGSVFLYCSVGSEAGTAGLIAAALMQGKKVYLPRCVRRGEMKLIRLRNEAELRAGRYGIPEPAGNEEICGIPDLCIVPGLAFDASGARLGYGGGYYDRYLAAAKPVAAALAYPCQMAARLPVCGHDVPVNYIITPAGITACDERA